MLEHLGRPAEAAAIEAAVEECIRERLCTPEVGGKLTTEQAGDAVSRRLETQLSIR
jgi:isocitrate/isopropylmalate dehydrogenase